MIPAKKAFIGMLVTVIDEKAVYMLTKAPINMSDSWEKVTFAGGAYLTREDLNESYIREQKLLEILK
jgi:Na+/alanine symporter